MPNASLRQSGTTKPKRKRARKTRTAIVSHSSCSSSSSSSSSGDDSDVDRDKERVAPGNERLAEVDVDYLSSSDDTSDSSESGLSDDSSGDESASIEHPLKSTAEKGEGEDGAISRQRILDSPPPEITTEFPNSDTYIDELRKRVNLKANWLSIQSEPRKMQPGSVMKAQERKRKAIAEREARLSSLHAKKTQTIGDNATREEDFKALWMRLVVDEFGEELDVIRKKEPSLSSDGPGSRMPLLIDALQAGSEVFSREKSSEKGTANGSKQVDEVGLMLWEN